MCSVDEQADSASLRQPCFPPPVASRQGDSHSFLVEGMITQLLSAPTTEGVAALSFRVTADNAALPVPHEILDEAKKQLAMMSEVSELADPERAGRIRAWLARLDALYKERCAGITTCLEGVTSLPEGEKAILAWLEENPLPNLARTEDVARIEKELEAASATRYHAKCAIAELQDNNIFSGENYENHAALDRQMELAQRSIRVRLFDATWGI